MADEQPPQPPEPTTPPPAEPTPPADPPPAGYPPPPPGAGPPPGYGQAPPPPPPPYAPPGYGQQPGSGQPPGYGPPPGSGRPPPGYGQPAGYGYGYEAPSTEGQAVAAFVVALVGLFVCGVITGIVALVLANQAQQKIDASGGRLTGSGLVTAARVIAVISIVLSVLGLLIIIAN